MRPREIWIKQVSNHSKKYGNYFLEFTTRSDSHFHQRLAIIGESFIDDLVRKELSHVEPSGKVTDILSPEQRNRAFHTLQPIMDRMNFWNIPNPEIETLKGLVSRCLRHYVKYYSKEYQGHCPMFTHSWVVAFRKFTKDSTPHLHHHNPLNISGIYYAAGEFKKGNGQLRIFRDETTELEYLPAEGKLILFPSTLPHALGDYDSNKLRVSIAFDCWFSPHKKKPFIRI